LNQAECSSITQYADHTVVRFDQAGGGHALIRFAEGDEVPFETGKFYAFEATEVAAPVAPDPTGAVDVAIPDATAP
jgi:hypothetical protein